MSITLAKIKLVLFFHATFLRFRAKCRISLLSPELFVVQSNNFEIEIYVYIIWFMKTHTFNWND